MQRIKMFSLSFETVKLIELKKDVIVNKYEDEGLKMEKSNVFHSLFNLDDTLFFLI